MNIIPEPKDSESKPEAVRVHLVQIECPTCRGWGRWDDIPCTDCQGDGVKWEMQPAEDQASNRLAGNLLEPLTFTDGEIDVFLRDNRCACGSHLVKYPAPARLWQAVCPTCGPAMSHNHITKAAAGRVRAGQAAGERELAPERKRRAEKDILRDLGF